MLAAVREKVNAGYLSFTACRVKAEETARAVLPWLSTSALVTTQSR